MTVDSKISDVAAYIAEKYPHKHELSKARLTKLVYLADWNHVEAHGRQITAIRWYFHNFGPYVDDVADAAKRDGRLKSIFTKNYFGDLKQQFLYVGRGGEGASLKKSEKAAIDSAISETQTMYWDAFIKYVYKTAPIRKSERYTYLDLIQFRGL